MKKTNPNLSFLHMGAAAVALVLILLLITTTTLTVAAEEGGCNATRIADCLADDEEFLMESETTRRILETREAIATKALNPNVPYCDRIVYGNCIGPNGKIYNKRPCDYLNTCGFRADEPPS